MFASVVFIAYFTAAVTSNLTLQQLRGDISGPEDLPGKRVASVKASTASEYLRQHNVEAMEYAKVERHLQALQQARWTRWFMTRPFCSITRRTMVTEKSKSSVDLPQRKLRYRLSTQRRAAQTGQ